MSGSVLSSGLDQTSEMDYGGGPSAARADESRGIGEVRAVTDLAPACALTTTSTCGLPHPSRLNVQGCILPRGYY